MEQKRLQFEQKSLNAVPQLKRAMARAVRASGMSRAEVAERMNAHIMEEGLRTRGKDGLVTEDMIHKWLAPEDAMTIPTKLLKIFGTVTGSAAPAATTLPEGYIAIGPQEIMEWEFGKAMLEGKKVQRRIRRIAEQIEERK